MVQNVIYIVGPTAVGKTDVANKLALHFKIPVLSMDSMQIYRYLDIGTSKPSKNEISNIEYYGIDLIEPDSHYSVGDYINYANQIISSINKKAIIVCGGTGLYYDGLTIGFSKIPPKNQDIRQELIEYSNKFGIENLYKLLQDIDPIYSKKISGNDLKRIIRALEVYKITGKPFSEFHKEKDIKPINFNSLRFALIMPRKKLYSRIDLRVDIMFQNGFIDEAKILYEKYNNKDLPSLKALGYSDLFEYFDGKITLEEAKENIKKKTRNYAKRQITYFKKDDKINWIYILDKDELNIAKNISMDKFDLKKFKRKNNRKTYDNLESELLEFISKVKYVEFVSKENLLSFFIDRISNFM